MDSKSNINHNILIDFCDWVASHGPEVPIAKLNGWGLTETSNGTYEGSYACPTGTTLFLSLGDNSIGTSYMHGACAKLTREGMYDDIIRADWRSWIPKECEYRPHVHINGSKIYIDEERSWSNVRGTVIDVMQDELGDEFDSIESNWKEG